MKIIMRFYLHQRWLMSCNICGLKIHYIDPRPGYHTIANAYHRATHHLNQHAAGTIPPRHMYRDLAPSNTYTDEWKPGWPPGWPPQ